MNTHKDKVVLITGASKRIGKIIAEGLNHSQLILHYYQSEQEAMALQKELQAHGIKTSIFKADLTQKDQIEALFNHVKNEHGKLDVLINNAASYEKSTIETFERDSSSFGVNLFAALNCIQKASDLMLEGSCIINITDMSAKFPFKNHLLHSLSKSALESATQALAKELSPRVRINALRLGLVLPEVGGSQDSFDKLVNRHVLLKRAPSAKELVSAITFLIENTYVNSTTLEFDGGWI